MPEQQLAPGSLVQPAPVIFGCGLVPTPDDSKLYMVRFESVNGSFAFVFDPETFTGLRDTITEMLAMSGGGLHIPRPTPEGGLKL